MVALDQSTGKLLWKTPVGKHNGHDNDGQLTIARPVAKVKSPRTVFPGILGGVESQLASNGTMAYRRGQRPPPRRSTTRRARPRWVTSARAPARSSRSTRTPARSPGSTSSRARRTAPRAISNDVALHDDVRRHGLGPEHARRARCSGARSCRPARTRPVGIAGDTVMTAGSFPLAKTQKATIVAYRLPSDPYLAQHPKPTSGWPARTGPSPPRAAGRGAARPPHAGVVATTGHRRRRRRRRHVERGRRRGHGGRGQDGLRGQLRQLPHAGRRGHRRHVGPNLDDLKPSMATVVHQVDERRRRDARLREPALEPPDPVRREVRLIGRRQGRRLGSSEGSGLP